MSFDPGTAELLAQFFSDTFLGIHLVTLGMSLHSQLYGNPATDRKVHTLLLVVTLAMGVIGMFNASLGVALNILAWHKQSNNVYIDAPWPYKLINVNIVVQSLIGDATWIYRCWIVYERRWRAISVSILLWIAGLVVSILVVIKAGPEHRDNGINNPSLTPYIGSALVLTVVLNVVTTSLIVFRIWNVSRGVRTHMAAQQKLTYVIRIVVESGLLYTLSAIFVLITSILKSNVDYIAGHCFVQVIGISFNLVIVRFDQNLADRREHQHYSGSSSISFNDIPAGSGSRVLSASPVVRVHVSRDVVADKGRLPSRASDFESDSM